MTKKSFLSFNKSKIIVAKFNILTKTEWIKFTKSKKFPPNIPKYPNESYQKEWISWYDWFGPESTVIRTNRFLSLDDSKKFVHNLHLSSIMEWNSYVKTGKLPKNIPRRPEGVYKNKGWISYKDWLGNSRNFLSYDQAKEKVKKFNIKSFTHWNRFKKEGKCPRNMPKNPSDYYGNEFISYGDFFGTGNVANQNRKFLSYDEAKKKVKELGITTQKEWKEYSKTKLKLNIPHDPQKSYKEFTTWGTFLGTGNVANQNRKFLSYDEAKKKVIELGIPTLRQWQKWVSEKNIPKNIPTNPSNVYSKVWKKNGGWGGFLGTNEISPIEKSANYLSIDDAKKQYKILATKYNLKNINDWKEFARKNKELLEKLRLPARPELVYSKDRIWKKMKSE